MKPKFIVSVMLSALAIFASCTEKDEMDAEEPIMSSNVVGLEQTAINFAKSINDDSATRAS